MDWSQHSIPAMRLETRFGDRVVQAFCDRPGSLWAMIAEAAERNPDSEALICGDRRMNWREVAEQSARIATGFQRLGLQPGDRIAVLLGNRTEFVLTMFAAAHAGLVTVLLSIRQQKPEIAYVLTDCGARLLIHEATLEDRVPMRATCLISCIGFPSTAPPRNSPGCWTMPPRQSRPRSAKKTPR